jgi:hypothetical protein
MNQSTVQYHIKNHNAYIFSPAADWTGTDKEFGNLELSLLSFRSSPAACTRAAGFFVVPKEAAGELPVGVNKVGGARTAPAEDDPLEIDIISATKDDEINELPRCRDSGSPTSAEMIFDNPDGKLNALIILLFSDGF